MLLTKHSEALLTYQLHSQVQKSLWAVHYHELINHVCWMSWGKIRCILMRWVCARLALLELLH